MFEYDKTKDRERQIPCRNCDGKTFHKVLHSVHHHAQDEAGDIDVWEDFEIVQCQGCKEISYRTCLTCSEDIDEDPITGKPFLIENVSIYPNRLAGRKQLRDVYLLPSKVLNLYKEVHGAFCSQFSVLTSAGIRALVELVCVEKGALGGDLKEKIDDLVKRGILTVESAAILHSTRFIGNKSLHEFTAPAERELSIVMDIVENLLTVVYIIPQKAEKLKANV